MATTQNNPYPYKDIPFNQSFWATVRLQANATPEQMHRLYLKHGHPTQSENLDIPNFDGTGGFDSTGGNLPNPNYSFSLPQDKPEMSILSIPEKTRANDVRYGPVGVNPETGMPDGVTMSGLPGASAVPFPSYQPPEGVVVNNPNVNNPYPDYVDPYSIENRYYDAVTNQQERDALSLLSDYDRENVNLFALQDRIENPLEDLSLEEILSLNNPAPVVDTRPATISPLGSLDTTYINDIDFSGLINTPAVNVPVTTVDPIGNPVTPSEIPSPTEPVRTIVPIPNASPVVTPTPQETIIEPIDTLPIEPVYIPPTEPIGTIPTLPTINLLPETYADPVTTLPSLPYSEPIDYEALAEALGLLGGSVPSVPNILPPSLLNSPVGSGFSPVVAATPSYGLLDR